MNPKDALGLYEGATPEMFAAMERYRLSRQTVFRSDARICQLERDLKDAKIIKAEAQRAQASAEQFILEVIGGVRWDTEKCEFVMDES